MSSQGPASDIYYTTFVPDIMPGYSYRPLTTRDSSDITKQKKDKIAFREKNSNRATFPAWTSSSFEYNNSVNNGFIQCFKCCDNVTITTPQLDYSNSSQKLENYLGNLYLTKITVAWNLVKCATNYKVFLVECQSNDTSTESDETKACPSNFILRTGTSPSFTYELQYSFMSEYLSYNTTRWSKTFCASSRNAKIYAFVFAYDSSGNRSPTNNYSIRFSVFDIKPQIPLNTWPTLDFENTVATRTVGLIDNLSIRWESLQCASYYKVFFIEGDGTLYVQSQTRYSTNPQKFDNTGSLFTSNSGNVDGLQYFRNYLPPEYIGPAPYFNGDTVSYLGSYYRCITSSSVGTLTLPTNTTNWVVYTPVQYAKVTVFVYAFDASNIPCPIPGRSITFNATSNTITLDYTLTSSNNGINYYLNENESSYLSIKDTLPLDHLNSKPF